MPSPQQEVASKIRRSVSWARQLELQEPPHDDSFDSPHMAPHMAYNPLPSTPGALASQAGSVSQPTAKASASAQGTELALPSESQQSLREGLDAYYKAKQTAAALLSQEAATAAAPASFTNAAPREGSSASVQAAKTATVGSRIAALETLATQAGSVIVPEGSLRHGGTEEILGLPARRASLTMPLNRTWGSADLLSPGKPGLKSQLVKMMEEVAQARSEVQGLQSELSVQSRLGLRSSSIANSLISSNSVADAI